MYVDIVISNVFNLNKLFVSFAVGKKQAPFSMAIGNVELIHECFPKHSRMGTARIK